MKDVETAIYYVGGALCLTSGLAGTLFGVLLLVLAFYPPLRPRHRPAKPEQGEGA